MADLQQTVPAKSATAIEYPGFVKNVDAALETLGGTSTVTAALVNDVSPVLVRFRPKDSLCHPVFADRQSTTNLLVKLSRKTGDEDAPVKAEVVSRVEVRRPQLHFRHLPAAGGSFCGVSSQRIG